MRVQGVARASYRAARFVHQELTLRLYTRDAWGRRSRPPTEGEGLLYAGCMSSAVSTGVGFGEGLLYAGAYGRRVCGPPVRSPDRVEAS